MRILLTGATGYIGQRLLPPLLQKGHSVVCAVRDKNRFSIPEGYENLIQVIEVDFLKQETLVNIPKQIDGAYYLIHSMSGSRDFEDLEIQCAQAFRQAMEKTTVKHVIYLSGIVNEGTLSRHLASRKAVEMELTKGGYACTTLRAGIIIGSGSGSFEIIRDLVEKLPLMVAPKWLNTKCQPIGIGDVINFLVEGLFKRETYNDSFDIGGPDILTYKEMLLGFAKVRGLRRWIFTVPVMTPTLSSYWLYFITSTSYNLASALVKSMKIEVICRDDRLNHILGIYPISYHAALERTFAKVDQHAVVSSWKDSLVSGRFDQQLSEFLEVPSHGCYVDKRERPYRDRQDCIDRIWGIGGETGWYYASWLWRIRGFLDKLVGGVGLRRGRTHPKQLKVGDAVDFWRVLFASKTEGRLLLFAEMKLPGEAWLEFRIRDNILIQTATFRPKGLLGRLYWYAVAPLHEFVFKGMINGLTK